jgi:hypothetical protein
MAAPNVVSSTPLSYSHLLNLSVNVGTLSAVNTITTSEQSITVTGLQIADSLQPGDQVLSVTKPTYQAGLAVTHGRVSAANTLIIGFVNPTAGNITPTASEVYNVVIWRPSAPFNTTFAG